MSKVITRILTTKGEIFRVAEIKTIRIKDDMFVMFGIDEKGQQIYIVERLSQIRSVEGVIEA